MRNAIKNQEINLNLLLTALNTVSEAVLVVDKHLNILYSNVTVEIIAPGMGKRVDFDEILKRYSLIDLKRHKELRIDEMPIVRALMGLKFQDYRLIFKDKITTKEIYLTTNGTPIISDDHEIIGCVLTMRDITKEFLHERELRLERSFFKNILDLIPAVILVKDLDSHYYFMNQTADDFLNEITKIHGEEGGRRILRSKTHEHDLEVMNALTSREFDEDFLWSDGVRKYYRTIRFPLYHQQSQKVLIGAIAFDLSERIRMEKMLEEERIRSINAAKLASIGTLAGEIGHEINNPIAIVKSITFILSDMLNDNNLADEFLKEKLCSIDSTLDRVTQIIRSLKNLSRKVQNDERTQCHLETIINDVLALSELKFKKLGILFQLDLSGIAPNTILSCHEVQISEVLLNILSNAADAVEDLPNPMVKLFLTEDQGNYFIHIQDNGPGIPFDLAGRVFEPFFTTKDIGKGTGLGLSISRNIMRNHGGDLFINNSFHSNTLTLRLPKES